MNSGTVLIAVARSSYGHTREAVHFGAGISLSVSSVMMPRVPSEPTMGKEAQQMSGTKVPACKVLLDSLSQQSAGSPESNERAEAGPAENHPTHKTVKLRWYHVSH